MKETIMNIAYAIYFLRKSVSIYNKCTCMYFSAFSEDSGALWCATTSGPDKKTVLWTLEHRYEQILMLSQEKSLHDTSKKIQVHR